MIGQRFHYILMRIQKGVVRNVGINNASLTYQNDVKQ